MRRTHEDGIEDYSNHHSSFGLTRIRSILEQLLGVMKVRIVSETVSELLGGLVIDDGDVRATSSVASKLHCSLSKHRTKMVIDVRLLMFYTTTWRYNFRR